MPEAFAKACRLQKFPGSKGMGVIASEDIKAGELIAEYVGVPLHYVKLARCPCAAGTPRCTLSHLLCWQAK